MTSGDRGVFSERTPRPRARREDAPPTGEAASQGDGALPGGSAAVSAPAPAAGTAPLPAADAGEVLRDVRQAVRSTVDEWLAERSHTISLAVTQVVEDALTRLQVLHAARVRELAASYEERLAAAERDRSEAVRGAMRRRRARMRAVERELRDKIERLERSLGEASMEAVERMREVERRHTDLRLEAERAHQEALHERDDEIARLRRAGSADASFDSLAGQLRSRRPGTGEH